METTAMDLLTVSTEETSTAMNLQTVSIISWRAMPRVTPGHIQMGTTAMVLLMVSTTQQQQQLWTLDNPHYNAVLTNSTNTLVLQT
jgi:hypothetical protein